MSNLWNLGHLKPREDIVVEGETMSALFRNAAAQRTGQVFMRQKKLGIWREWTWIDTARAVREIGDGCSRSASMPVTAPRSPRTRSSNGCSPIWRC